LNPAGEMKPLAYILPLAPHARAGVTKKADRLAQCGDTASRAASTGRTVSKSRQPRSERTAFMCGIAGILYAEPTRSADCTALMAMGDAIAHRGPDAEGSLIEPGVGLIHRRLSIIDLAGGDQPIGNEDGSIQVVFNGEIYNYRELRAGLEERGHRFRTRSDTEVLVHLYEELGEGLVDRLRGMFAFAIWDRNERSLLLARDRLGIKPLYVYRDAQMLLFGSELKAILAYPGIAREIDPEALESYLAYGCVLGPKSIFRGIEKLSPGHTLRVGPGNWGRSPRRYWELKVEPDESLDGTQWEEAVAAKLEETVRAHLIADVPVGAFLSGGIDSGTVVASASGSASEPLRTFSIGFDEEAFSELPAARLVAGRYATAHTEEIVRPDAVSLLDELARLYDEPFADSSAIPTYLVSRLASQGVKVVLTGDGGDEAFGGYARYAHDLKEAALRRVLPAWFLRRVLGPLGDIWPKGDRLPRPLRWKTLMENLARDPAGAYANTLTVCRPPRRRRLLDRDLAVGLNGFDPSVTVRDAFARGPAGDALGGMIAADVVTILPDDFLVKVDRASMAWGLEARPPLLDHELMELAARIPSRLKIHRGQTKALFRRVARRHLPAELLGLPKRGFEVPIDTWLRGPLAGVCEDAVFGRDTALAGLIDPAEARAVFDAHRSGVGRHGALLWSLLVLAKWAEYYLKPSTSGS
jgi:asparagine synthase (glutamine-hydrolysing)